MNKCCFLGRLTADPEYEEHGNTHVVNFSLAINAFSKEKRTDYFKFVAFGRTSEVIRDYVFKGDRLAVVAHAFKPPKYQNKDGYTIYPEIVFQVEQIDFIETRSDREAPKTQKEYRAKKKEQEQANDFVELPEGISEELPFA